MTDYSLNSPATWYETMMDLQSTLRRWGVKTGEWSVEPPREPLKRGAPQEVAINFVHPTRGQVRVSIDRWSARLNLRALWLSLEDLRMVEKRGMLETLGTVFKQLTAPKSASDILGVPASASPEQVRLAYRALASVHHPDVGGDPAYMAEINDAYSQLTARR